MIYVLIAVLWIGGLAWIWALLAAGARADEQLRKILEQPVPTWVRTMATTTLDTRACPEEPPNYWDPHGPDCPPCCERLPEGVHCPKHCHPL